MKPLIPLLLVVIAAFSAQPAFSQERVEKNSSVNVKPNFDIVPYGNGKANHHLLLSPNVKYGVRATVLVTYYNGVTRNQANAEQTVLLPGSYTFFHPFRFEKSKLAGAIQQDALNHPDTRIMSGVIKRVVFDNSLDTEYRNSVVPREEPKRFGGRGEK